MYTYKRASVTQGDHVWQDPLAYNPIVDGPPYFPGMQAKIARTVDPRAKTTPIHDMMREITSQYTYHQYEDSPAYDMARMAATLVFLRALAVIYQTHHWQSRGPNFYGDHLMYERLYDSVNDSIDQVAERTVSLSGNPVQVSPVLQTQQVAKLVDALYRSRVDTPSVEESVEICIAAENSFLSWLDTARKELDEWGALSQGLDNLIQGLADKHEDNLYLLQQRRNVIGG